MGATRSFVGATLAALLLVGTADRAASLQDAPQDAPPGHEDCGARATITVTVLDDTGLIPIPAATVVLRWTDAVERPVREPAGSEGRLLLCVPPDARHATLWAEFGDASSER